MLMEVKQENLCLFTVIYLLVRLKGTKLHRNRRIKQQTNQTNKKNFFQSLKENEKEIAFFRFVFPCITPFELNWHKQQLIPHNNALKMLNFRFKTYNMTF